MKRERERATNRTNDKHIEKDTSKMREKENWERETDPNRKRERYKKRGEERERPNLINNPNRQSD